MKKDTHRHRDDACLFSYHEISRERCDVDALRPLSQPKNRADNPTDCPFEIVSSPFGKHIGTSWYRYLSGIDTETGAAGSFSRLQKLAQKPKRPLTGFFVCPHEMIHSQKLEELVYDALQQRFAAQFDYLRQFSTRPPCSTIFMN